MRRLLTAAWFLPAIAFAALWVRSYFVMDYVTWVPADGAARTVFQSCAGSVVVVRTQMPGNPAEDLVWESAPDPEPVAGGYLAALGHFRADDLPFGVRGRIVAFPQWALVAFAAAYPVARPASSAAGTAGAGWRRRRRSPSSRPSRTGPTCNLARGILLNLAATIRRTR